MSEREQASEVLPGMEIIAKQMISGLRRLDNDRSAEGVSNAILQGNGLYEQG